MSKSSKLLRLDPFAIALEKRKEREQAEAPPPAEVGALALNNVGVHNETQAHPHTLQPSRAHNQQTAGAQSNNTIEAHTSNQAGVQETLPIGVSIEIDTGAHSKFKKGVQLQSVERAHLSALPGASPSPFSGVHSSNEVGAHSLDNTGAHHLDTVGDLLPTRGVNTPAKSRAARVNTPIRGKSVRTQKSEAGEHKTDRHSADKKKVNFYMNRERVREMNVFATRCDLTLTEFFELAGAHFMECVGVHKLKDVGGNTPHDELKIYRTSNEIVTLYKQYTGGRWKPHCDYAAEQFNSADLRYVEIGILNTLLKFKGKKINSFRYFVPEVEEALAVKLGEETLEIMLKRRRQQWEEKRKNLT